MDDAYKKQKIPKALREQVWIHKIGRKFDSKCRTPWCKNKITVFDFQCGHDIPESKGGTTNISNLVPICSRCNLSMGNQYTFSEWCDIHKTSPKWIVILKNILGAWNSSDTKVHGIKSIQNNTNQNDRPLKSRGVKLRINPQILKKHTETISKNTEKM